MRAVFIALLLSLPIAAWSAPHKVTTYPDEEQARIRCPQDTIVWFNPHTRLWYTRKSRHFANDGYGGFVCEQDVKKAGYRQGKD